MSIERFGNWEDSVQVMGLFALRLLKQDVKRLKNQIKMLYKTQLRSSTNL